MTKESPEVQLTVASGEPSSEDRLPRDSFGEHNKDASASTSRRVDSGPDRALPFTLPVGNILFSI
jgi:hypothetical protein